MGLLPPRVTGPLSECNRTVVVTNACPGAAVTLVSTSGGTSRRVWQKVATGSRDTIPLDLGEELHAGESVTAYQERNGERSDTSPDGPEVQQSVAEFGPVEVVTTPIACAKGVHLGGMRPGTRGHVLHSGTRIGDVEALDGTAFVPLATGVPTPSAGLRSVVVFDAPWFEDALVVQPRYIALLLAELRDGGWRV